MTNEDQDLTDEDILSGHPSSSPNEVEEVQEDQSSQLVTVKIDGKEYLMSADQAEVFQTREREFKRKLSEQGAELGRLRRQTSPLVQTQPVQQEEDEDVDVALFKNPKEYLKKFEDRIINKVTTAYRQKTAMDQFWIDFYEENQDLKRAKVLAEAILSRNSAYFGPMLPHECIEELARMTRDEMAKLGVTQPEPEQRTRRTVVESPTIRRPAPPQKPAGKAKTVVDIMSARKAARTRARLGHATA